MMEKSNFLWALAANIVNAGLWAALIPISSRYLGVEDTALWLNFVVLAGVGQLLELGFNPTLARSYSYVYAGAQSLKAVGLGEAHGVVNPALHAELVYASQKVYLLIGLSSAIVLWGGGSLYLAFVIPAGIPLDRILVDWCLYSLGSIVSLWFGYTNSMILGRGDVRFFNQVLLLTRGLQLLLSIGGLVAGGGLLWLSAAALISALTGRLFAYFHVKSEVGEARRLSPSASATNALVKVLWHNSGRYGLVMIGAFLITRANVLIAGATIGLVPAAGYNFSVQVLTFLQSFAGVPFNMNLPRLNALWARQQYEQVRNIFGASLVAGILIFLAGAIAFITAGPSILQKISGNIALPETWLLAIMAVTFLLEFNHGTCANLLTVANKVPFVGASLLTGFAIVITSWFVAPHAGVIGLVGVVSIFQLLYNNWKWPYSASHALGTTYYRLFTVSLINLRGKRNAGAAK
jgi:O-antigen/teichoic acid export membrane protein